jgi:hypothetical protein
MSLDWSAQCSTPDGEVKQNSYPFNCLAGEEDEAERRFPVNGSSSRLHLL